MADLSAATIEDVRNFFRSYYTPNNSTMVIGGDVDTAAARALAQKYFGDIPRGPAVTRTPPPAFRLDTNRVATIEDRVQVPRVYNAWHTVRAFAPDDAALDIVATILATGRASRLYKALVYEKQIASNVVAFQDGSRIDGKFELFSTARPGHDLPELQRVIDDQVRLLADSGPTTRELERAQNSIEADFLNAMERMGSFGGKADRLNFYNYYVGTPDYFEQDLDRYRRVTVDAGTARDPADVPGLAAFTANMLTQGAGTRGALALADEVAYLGAQLNAVSDFDAVTVRLHVPSRHLDAALDLLADVLLRPQFADSEITRQRGLLATTILQQRDQPVAMASIAFPAIVLGAAHPYGHPTAGNDSTPPKLTHDRVVSVYRRPYRPNATNILVVGDITLAQAQRLFTARLGGGAWPRGTVTP